MSYRFPATVTAVFESKLKKHVAGAGAEAVFTTNSAGWYIQVNGLTSFYVGFEKPEFEVGDKIELKLQRSQHEQSR